MLGPVQVLDNRSGPWHPRVQSRIYHPVSWISMPQCLPKAIRPLEIGRESLTLSRKTWSVEEGPWPQALRQSPRHQLRLVRVRVRGEQVQHFLVDPSDLPLHMRHKSPCKGSQYAIGRRGTMVPQRRSGCGRLPALATAA